MKGVRTALLYFALVLGTCVAVEATCFLVLLRDEMKTGKTMKLGIDALLLRHPLKFHRHAFGLFDPINTLFMTSNSTWLNLRSNSWGFFANEDDARDPPVFPEKSAGVTRIVVFGGSSMAGAGASKNSSTISANLERLLRESGLKVEVFNYGVGGAATYGELVRLISDAVYIEPDVVLFMNGWNDVGYTLEGARQHLPHPVINWHLLAYNYFDYFHRVTDLTRVPPPIFTYAWLLVDKRLGVQDDGSYVPKLRAYERLPLYRLSGVYQARENYPGNIFCTNIQAMTSFSASRGIRFFHYLQPYPDHAKQLTVDEEKKITEQFAKHAADWGVSYSRANYNNALKLAYGQFSQCQSQLKEKYRGKADVFFFDITDIFATVREAVYADIIHYNDHGNYLLAKRFAADLVASQSLPKSARR